MGGCDVGFSRTTIGIGACGLLVLSACAAERLPEEAQSATGITGIPGGDTDGGTGSGTDGESAEATSGGGSASDSDTNADTGAGTSDGGVTDGAPKFDLGGGGDVPEQDGCGTDPMIDDDGDGFTEVDGDCNDCDANVNPAAIEVIDTEPDMMGNVPEPADEDCDGMVDNTPQPCDGAFALDDGDPLNAAAAMGLCKLHTPDAPWGVVSAAYVRANGVALGSGLQNGIMSNFGPNVAVREGSQLSVLSSGHSRIPGQPNPCNSQTCSMSNQGTAPAGFPQDVPNCPGSNVIYDDIALEVTLVAPSNATGYSFDFDFYSFEYPEWVCTSYNDQFIAHVTPPPPGSIDGNISFDAMTNPVSVNIAFFEVCSNCPLGTAELSGTGFDSWDDAGATSWLTTTAPVDPGQQITIRFTIWDTGDQQWDSSVLLDNFQWIADGGSVDVGTEPAG